jgi:hydrogenase expression/formation protein HypE
MRDPTRGGLASVCNEVRRATGMGLRLAMASIPIRDAVQSVCDMLGYDPLYLACEGRVVAIIDNQDANALLQAWKNLPDGQDAAIIGHISVDERQVVLETELGGERILEELEDDPLPRIC